MVNCTFTVSTKTAVCQGPNNAPKKNSHRRPRDIPQFVSAKMTSILIPCSIEYKPLRFYPQGIETTV